MLTSEIRGQVLEDWELSDKSLKKFDNGTGIRVGENPVYDEAIAYDWAVTHQMCLSLDKAAFEKMVKAKAMELDFVTFEEKITATIPTKL